MTRFSGRAAPEHPGGIPHLPDEITREAYSHEVSSCGFWPGNAGAPDPIFYAYPYPTPEGYAEAAIEPDAAFWHKDLGEFVLTYDALRDSDAPDETLHAFFQSAYEAAADYRSSSPRSTNAGGTSTSSGFAARSSFSDTRADTPGAHRSRNTGSGRLTVRKSDL